MKCKEVKNNLIFFYYNELPHDKMKQIEEHLFKCSSCRQEYHKLALALDYVREEKQFTPVGNMWEGVSKRISHQTTVVRKLRILEAVAIAASVIIAALLGSLSGRAYVNSIASEKTDYYQAATYDSLVNTFENLDENISLVMDQ